MPTVIFRLFLISILEYFSSYVSCLEENTTFELENTTTYRFALIPKSTKDPFFMDARDGCKSKAAQLNVECVYVGTEKENITQQLSIMNDLVSSGDIDGISISVIDLEKSTMSINNAIKVGVPVITFDSDAPESDRLAYVGSNNIEFGQQLGDVLTIIASTGGKYGILSASEPNLIERTQGIRERLSRWDSNWEEVVSSPKLLLDSSLALDEMWAFASNPEVNAILSCGGWPMTNSVRWKKFMTANPNITTVVGDANPNQRMLYKFGYGNLVGQLPYEMGSLSMTTLFDIKQGKKKLEKDTFWTNLVQLIYVPLDLPPLLVVNENLGNYVMAGYILFTLVALFSIGFAIWVFMYKNHRIVKAAQPVFLIPICMGALVMGFSLLSMTITDEKYSQRGMDVACMSVPWLISIGFTTIFSMLYSKTRRINKIMKNARRLHRVVVLPKDVIIPFALLLTANVIILTCLTILAPLVYTRTPIGGTGEFLFLISNQYIYFRNI